MNAIASFCATYNAVPADCRGIVWEKAPIARLVAWIEADLGLWAGAANGDAQTRARLFDACCELSLRAHDDNERTLNGQQPARTILGAHSLIRQVQQAVGFTYVDLFDGVRALRRETNRPDVEPTPEREAWWSAKYANGGA